MSSDSLKGLYDFYSPDEKNDFFVAYLYLKHMDRFMFNTLKTLGMETAEPEWEDNESLDEMLSTYVWQIAEKAPSPETNIYHGKVLKLEDARKMVTLDIGVDIDVPERVVPFKIARNVVIENPDAIAVGRCPCRKNQKEPCVSEEEQELCIIIGDPFAAFIAENNPDFRKCSQEEAVAIMEKAHRRGDVQTAYFKKEFRERLMAICNCCSCCCMGMVMWNRLNGAVPFLASSGYVSVVSEDCTGCGACADGACPFYAISLDESQGKAFIDTAKCMGCGVCEDICPEKALKLEPNPDRGDPLDLDMLR